MNKPKIFLSHFAHEAIVASALRDFIYRGFGQAVEVFLSSEKDSIQLGDDWQKRIRQGLKDSKICISLLSEDSLLRPWINFEAGAAWLNHAVVIPVVHRSLAVSSLPHPFKSFQATTAYTKQGIVDLVKRIEKHFNLVAHLDADACQNLADRIIELGHVIDAVDQEHQSIPNVTFSLYSKSHAQELANRADAGGALVSSFRKPNLSQVFKALRDTGQPYTRIVSIDEYWVGYLAQQGRLQKLTGRSELEYVFPELLSSCMFQGDYWSIPHFLDFSYYSVLSERQTKAVQHLRGLIANENYQHNLHDLWEIAHSKNILSYDIKTPDTTACVILEFLNSVGNGLNSFQSLAGFVDEKNEFALKLLKDLSGPRDTTAYTWAEPLNLDSVSNQAVFLRHWHSMATDEPECRKTHSAVFDFPIAGTLGGWHLAILANPPFPQEGSHALQRFLLPDRQGDRFHNGAGLPTLAKFYFEQEYSSLRDLNTQWTLSQIQKYVSRLIRRSSIRNFFNLRGLFWQLHNDLMTNPNPNYAELLSQCGASFFKNI